MTLFLSRPYQKSGLLLLLLVLYDVYVSCHSQNSYRRLNKIRYTFCYNAISNNNYTYLASHSIVCSRFKIDGDKTIYHIIWRIPPSARAQRCISYLNPALRITHWEGIILYNFIRQCEDIKVI